MAKTDTKKVQTFAAIIADSEPETMEVQLGDDNIILVRELSGRERFEAAEKATEANQWDVMLWMVNLGIVEPRPKSIDELEKIKPEWIKNIAAAIMKLSGMTMATEDDAEKESAEVIDIGGS
jgi:hypothetical protein